MLLVHSPMQNREDLVGQPNTSGQSHCLWMVDDDMQLCRLIQTFYEREGWTFRSFNAARLFELALLESRPDVAILDLMLPGKTGLELLEGMRRSGFSFPVLMLSAMGSPSDRVVGLEAGANDYVAKPFLCRELHLRILKMLDSSKIEPTAAKSSHPAAASYQWGSVVFEVDSRQLVCGELCKSLSRGDAALLEALCTASGPISRQELLSASGSLVDIPESRTIDVRIFRLRKVLKELSNGNDLIATIRGKGYQLTQLPLAIPRPE